MNGKCLSIYELVTTILAGESASIAPGCYKIGEISEFCFKNGNFVL